MEQAMNYKVTGKSVMAYENGNYKGELKCLSESDAEGAAEELRQGNDSPEADSEVAARWSAEWKY